MRPDLPLADGPVDADRQLIRSIAGGSAEALADLYDRYVTIVFGLARRITGCVEDAEEVVQDVFSQVWRQAGRYDESRATAAGWIVMLARARSIDRVRVRLARPDQTASAQLEALAPLAASSPSPEAAALGADDTRQIRAALEELPDTQRSLIELAYFEGLTHVEIAVQTRVPLGTVKTRLRSAMTTLRSALSPLQKG
ncbi:MAG: sigma-70 family RNA polymerase sigma factor [Vicinamibacterales bacterium]